MGVVPAAPVAPRTAISHPNMTAALRDEAGVQSTSLAPFWSSAIRYYELARVLLEACASCHGASLEGQLKQRQRLPDGRLPAPPLEARGKRGGVLTECSFRSRKKDPAA